MAEKEEKSWWDSFVEGVGELGTKYFQYDVAKTQASNNSTATTTPVTTTPTTSNNNTMLVVGLGVVALLVVVLAVRK